MKIKGLIIFSLVLIFSAFTFNSAFAEDKNTPGGLIPKLPQTVNDPELTNGHVYPEWGPVCQRYTYSTIYRDKEGRAPEYVKIYFNGKMIDMTKVDPNDNNYQKGVRYEYKSVPDKIDSNFYYFEASNGLGKTRDSIIDSPDNGPVLFESAFDKNEIVLIDSSTGDKLWGFPTNKEWVGGVALSDDGKYLAALTSQHVYLFSTSSNKPLWQYEFNQPSAIGGGPRGNGAAISGDGKKIVAAAGMEVVLFDQGSNKPLWQYQVSALAVTISKDGKFVAASAVKQEAGPQGGNVVLLWEISSKQPIREFGADSNFHDVSLSADGSYLAASTGCPDRKAYIFSKDSSQPIIKSERLTYDSPISKSKISADGSLAAFATEGGPNSSVAVLFNKDSKTPLWKFDNQKQNSSRALSFTPNGQYIGVATMRGDVYLLGKEGSQPLKSWQTNSSVGALDIADGGEFIALGGSDNQVWILPKNGSEKKIKVNEFIQSLDISANGKLIAAGTGGSVYFFESYLSPNKNKVFQCQTIIEPTPESQLVQAPDQNIQVEPALKYQAGKFPGMFFGFGFIGSLVLLGIFTSIKKLAFLEKPKLVLVKINQTKPLAYLHLTAKKVSIILLILTAVFFFLTVFAVLINSQRNADAPENKSLINQGEKSKVNDGNASLCGNDLCEPSFGETKESCPKDCSGGN